MSSAVGSLGTYGGMSGASARSGASHQRPDGGCAVVPADAPAVGESIDDAEPAAAERGQRRPGAPWLGRGATVAHRDLDDVAVAVPGHPYLTGGQRPGVPERVAEQFADDDRGIVHGGLAHAGRQKLSGKMPTGHCDT